MTAQSLLNVLEWITAGEAVLDNVGKFGRAYDRQKVERFQKANNLVVGLPLQGAVTAPLAPIRVDGIWGPETVLALKTLLARAPDSYLPAQQPEAFRLQQWSQPNLRASIALAISARRELANEVFGAPAPSPVPNATQAAGQEAQNAVAQAHNVLTEPAAPGPAPIQPPPDEAAPGPRPPSGPRAPIRLADEQVLGSRYRESGTDVPWFAIGLGVLAFAGVIGWAAYRKRQRAK
jgi:hypothetical protein